MTLIINSGGSSNTNNSSRGSSGLGSMKHVTRGVAGNDLTSYYTHCCSSCFRNAGCLMLPSAYQAHIAALGPLYCLFPLLGTQTSSLISFVCRPLSEDRPGCPILSNNSHTTSPNAESPLPCSPSFICSTYHL